MATITTFCEIEAWKKTREATKLVYEITGVGDFARDYGLKDQLRRSSVSVMSNIAEGFERDGNREFRNFLSIAKGSCGEVRSHLFVALDQNFINDVQFNGLNETFEQIGKMIGGLMNYLSQSDIRGKKFR